jgi:succinate dehydrogenase/fumarate reductase flavoprotein subunit
VDILLTCIVSLLAAIIGGWIAGKYALRAQKQAAEDQRQRDVEAERRMINNTLQAIGTELTVLATVESGNPGIDQALFA